MAGLSFRHGLMTEECHQNGECWQCAVNTCLLRSCWFTINGFWHLSFAASMSRLLRVVSMEAQVLSGWNHSGSFMSSDRSLVSEPSPSAPWSGAHSASSDVCLPRSNKTCCCIFFSPSLSPSLPPSFSPSLPLPLALSRLSNSLSSAASTVAVDWNAHAWLRLAFLGGVSCTPVYWGWYQVTVGPLLLEPSTPNSIGNQMNEGLDCSAANYD